VVEFDTGLNTAIRKLRVALGDVADTPGYIETLPRRGYRFLGTVDPAVDRTTPPALAESPGPRSTPGADGFSPVGAAPATVASATALTPAAVALAPAAAPAVADDTPQPIQATDPASPTFAARPSGRPQGRRLIAIAAALLVATALAAGVFYGRSHGTPEPETLPAAAPVTLLLPDHTVAVLPFENLSAESNNEFLALGIAETVLHRLASLQDLTVIARTSSFVFRNRDEDAREIGGKLNARFLVEGSVQRGRAFAGKGRADRCNLGCATLVVELRSTARGHLCSTG
jgi:hypothetical protein